MTNRAKIEEIIHLTSEYNRNLQRQYELQRSLALLKYTSEEDSEEDSEEEVTKKENEKKDKENAVVDALIFRISAILETE